MTEPVKKLWNKYRNKTYYVRLSTLERSEKHGHRIVSICKKDGTAFKGDYDANGSLYLLHLDNAVDYKPTQKTIDAETRRVIEECSKIRKES